MSDEGKTVGVDAARFRTAAVGAQGASRIGCSAVLSETAVVEARSIVKLKFDVAGS